MPRRGENIHKRKDGRWEARYKKGTDGTGSTIYGSVYAKTYREVKAKQQSMMRTAEAKKAAPNESPLFKEMLNLWMENNRVCLKGATEYRYRYLIAAHILPDLGDKSLDQLTGPVINAFLADKLDHGRLDGSGGLSSAYVRSMMLVIKSVMNFAASQNLCAPIQTKVNKPPATKTELPILSAEHQKKLESYCMAQVDETKLGILLSLYTGLRIGEVCALRWVDMDLRQQVIHVRHTVSRVSSSTSSASLIIDRPKTTASMRDIPICSWLVPFLTALQESNSSEFVVSRDDKFVSPRTYEYRYHKILHASGIPDINYHALRHTFATRCIENGVDVKSLSEILGHADASITLNTYVHSSLERKRTQLERMSNQIA